MKRQPSSLDKEETAAAEGTLEDTMKAAPQLPKQGAALIGLGSKARCVGQLEG